MVKSRIISKPTRKKIARLFTVSLMSNFKWRKMFSMLGPLNANLKLEQAIVKLIDDDAEHVVSASNGDWLVRTPPWAFIDIFQFGPIALNSIEWIEFPAFAEYERPPPNGTGRLPPTRVIQDIDRAQEIIANLGRYPVERTERGLRITGHIRRGM